MAVTANSAVLGIPVHDDMYVTVHPSGTALIINPGDYVIYSGHYAIAGEDAVGGFKGSGVGIALDRNPAYDWAGRQVINSSLLVATHGVFRVSASFSGNPLRGVLAYPVTTGSAVNSPSGLTGVGSTWNTAAVVSLSANGATGAPSLGVAQVIGWSDVAAASDAGTGQLDIRLWANSPDYI